MAKAKKDTLADIKHEIECWEEGLTYEEEALQAIEQLVRERLVALGYHFKEVAG